MLNLHHLQILNTLAACGSYSRAAERLGISQPAVSMQIKKLEESVGVALVSTRGRGVALTEAGQVLLGYGARLIRLNQEAEQAMLDFRDQRRGRLRIAASSTPGAYILPRAIAAFRREHPLVEVGLEVGNTRTALSLAADGTVDLAVVGEIDPAEVPELTIRPLCEDRLVVAVGPGHPWAAAGEVTAADLVREPLILREEGSSTRAVLDRRLASAGLRVRVGMELGATEAVKEAVAAGLGPAVLSGLALQADAAAGRMVGVPVIDLDLSRRLHLAWPGAEPAGLTARFVADLIRQVGQV